MTAISRNQIETTRTMAELRRIGLGGARGNYGPRAKNVFGAYSGTDGLIVLDDGQVRCWGTDGQIADALSELNEGDGWEAAWDALSGLESNA